MNTLSRSLSQAEIVYLHVLLCNASQSIARKVSIESLKTRVSKFGTVKSSVLRYLISLHYQMGSQKITHPNPTLLAQTESKIISILGFAKEQDSMQESVLTIKNLIGEMLVTSGLISKKQLDEAIAEQNSTNRKLGEILIKKKWITFEQLDEILTVQVDIRIDTHAEEQKMGFILTSQ